MPAEIKLAVHGKERVLMVPPNCSYFTVDVPYPAVNMPGCYEVLEDLFNNEYVEQNNSEEQERLFDWRGIVCAVAESAWRREAERRDKEEKTFKIEVTLAEQNAATWAALATEKQTTQ